MKIAIVSQCIKYYAGSERVVYELYHSLLRSGHDIHLGTAELGEFYFNELKPARVNDIPGCMDENYDLVICLHTHSFAYLFPEGVNCKTLLYFSLSPYEPIEFPFSQADLIDGYLCNSEETRERLINAGVENNKARVFPNATAFPAKYQKDEVKTLQKVLVVSNHIPEELLELRNLPGSLDFTYVGIDETVSFIDMEFLNQFDAIISIGYTVVFAVAVKVPVYIYDHFGGDGWLTSEKFSLNSHYNFSGRPNQYKRTSQEIYTDLIEGYCQATQQLDDIYLRMFQERNIDVNIAVLTEKVGSKGYSLRKPDIYSVNVANAYFKVFKSNQHLQNLVSQQDIITENQDTEENRLSEEMKNIKNSVSLIQTLMNVNKNKITNIEQLIDENFRNKRILGLINVTWCKKAFKHIKYKLVRS